MKANKAFLAASLLLLSVSAGAQAAITCIINKKSGQFESPDKSKDPAQVQELCATQASLDLLGAFAEAESNVEKGGTKVISGVLVTNLNDVTQNVQKTLRGRRISNQALSAESTPEQPSTWAVLASDGNLQQTFERWSKGTQWRVVWKDIPSIRVMSDTTLTDRNFEQAVDYALFKAQKAAAKVGMVLKPVMYSNKVLVISKEDQK